MKRALTALAVALTTTHAGNCAATQHERSATTNRHHGVHRSHHDACRTAAENIGPGSALLIDIPGETLLHSCLDDGHARPRRRL